MPGLSLALVMSATSAPARPSLVAGDYGERVVLLPGTFQRQDYAFALPTGSPLREPINRILARRGVGSPRR